MSDTVRTALFFVAMLGLIVLTGVMQSWNVALGILNMGLISAIMALGVNMQWGYAGLFNVGVMGFVALGGLGAVVVSMPPVPERVGGGRPARSGGAGAWRRRDRRRDHGVAPTAPGAAAQSRSCSRSCWRASSSSAGSSTRPSRRSRR